MIKDLKFGSLSECKRLVESEFLKDGLVDRLKHTLAVAELASHKAVSMGLEPERAEMLGLLHDIGYCSKYAVTGFHPLDGYNALVRFHPDLARDMALHTSTPEEASMRRIELPFVKQSIYAAILSFADCRVDSKGVVVSFEDRLADIIERYGADSLIGKANLDAWARLARQEQEFGL